MTTPEEIYNNNLGRYTELTGQKKFKIAGTDINEDITLTVTQVGDVSPTRTTPQQRQILANTKPRKKFNFTKLKDNIIDFEGIPDNSQKVRVIANNYDVPGINNYLNYAQNQANISGHQCGPTHDEKVKWRLRDIQSQQLNPMLDKVNGIKNQASKQECLNADCGLDTKKDEFKSRIAFLERYITNIGTPEQIKKNIDSYYQYLVDAVNTDRKIIQSNNKIIVYTNLQYDAAGKLEADNKNLVNSALESVKDEFGILYNASIDKTKKYYKDIKSQNNIVNEKVNKIKDYGTKMEREFESTENSVPFIGTFKNWLFIIFYVLLFVLIVLCYFAKTRYELMSRIFTILCLGALPFFAYTIELFLYNNFSYLYSFVLNKPYNNDNLHYNPTKGTTVNGDILSLNHLKNTDGKENEPIDSTYNFEDLDKSNLNFLSTRSMQTFYNDITDYFNRLNIGLNVNNVFNSLANGQ
jgi:hypothetical protein